jgi:dihydrofolate reductase
MSSIVVYSMQVSLDGFMEDQNGAIDWCGPDEEVHRFHNDQARAAGANLYGRRLYELMAAYWPTSSPDYGVGECQRRQ